MQKSTGRFHCAMRALALACLALSGSALGACARRPSPSPNASGLSAGDTLDVLIAGGTVYDGLRPEARRVDVGLRGDRVVSLGAVPRGVVVKRRIDAEGLIVAPGFIDPHTQANHGMPRRGHQRGRQVAVSPFDPSSRQGVAIERRESGRRSVRAVDRPGRPGC